MKTFDYPTPQERRAALLQAIDRKVTAYDQDQKRLREEAEEKKRAVEKAERERKWNEMMLALVERNEQFMAEFFVDLSPTGIAQFEVDGYYPIGFDNIRWYYQCDGWEMAESLEHALSRAKRKGWGN